MTTTTTRLWVGATNRFHEMRQDERGLTTTEVAVLTFVLVAIAVAVGALLFNYARDTVSNAPKPEIPSFSE